MKKDSNLEKYYDNTLLVTVSRRSYYEEKIVFFSRILQSKKSSQILDIGCNDGELTELYTKYGEATGIDINKNAIKKCKERGLTCFCVDLNDLVATHKNYFDVVIAGDIIEHIFDTDLFLHNINTVLKKNGVLLLTTPNLVSLGRRVMMLAGVNPFIEFSTKLPSEEYNVGHIRYYTAQNLREQLASQNFNNTKILGDRINILPGITIPHFLAQYVPGISRNFLVYAEKK